MSHEPGGPLQAHLEGWMTSGEVFGHWLVYLLEFPTQLPLVFAVTRVKPSLFEAFLRWLGAMSLDTEVYHQGEILVPTAELIRCRDAFMSNHTNDLGVQGMEPILFYSTKGPYGSFSNFSRDPVTIFKRTWLTSEAAFQAMKFHPHRPDLIQQVFDADGPKAAAAMGRDRSLPMSDLWEQHWSEAAGDGLAMVTPAQDLFSRKVDDGRGVDFAVRLYKDAVMFVVVLAKVVQDPEITKTLLDTGDAAIIEDTRTSGDGYWGWGTDMKGVNRLGKILMSIRKLIRDKGVEGAAALVPQICAELNLP